MSASFPARRPPFPVPLHPPDEARERSSALPRPLTSFVGRSTEITSVCALLRNPDARLVTLTGPGGAGKTRLAIRIAEALTAEFAAICFIPLSAVTDPALVVPAIAQILGVREAGERPLIDRLAAHLSGGATLVVLDNFEQVTDAAIEVTDLLSACPELKILVTSRVVLRVSGEHDVPVPPLDVPADAHDGTLEDLASHAAVSLFIQRAHAANALFELTTANAKAVVEICEKLDGLPLALELAAAHSRMFSPNALLARLTHRLGLLVGGPRDQPIRLQSMRDAIAWSYDLLPEEHQAWFRILSVFVDGFTLESAQAVAEGLRFDDGRAVEDAFMPAFVAIEALVDASLVVREPKSDGEPRFRLLETIREFGLDQLAASGEESTLRAAHAAYYLNLAEEAETRLIAAGASSWVERLAVEWPNVRAGVAWTLASGDSAAVLRLAGTILTVAYARGEPAEGLSWLEAALGLPGTVRPDLEVDAYFTASALAQVLGDFDRSTALSERGIALARAYGYAFGEARALLGLGITAEWQGDLDAAFAHYSAADSIMRGLEAMHRLPHWVVLPLANLADLALLRGDTAQAIRLGEEAAQHWREAGYVWGIAQAQGTVAAAVAERGELARAARLYKETLDHWLSCDDGRGIAGTIAGIAGLSAALGQLERAARLLGAALGLRERLGLRFLAHHIYAERVLAATRSRLDAKTFESASAEGARLSLGAAIAEANALLEAASSAARPTHGLTPREFDVLRYLVAGRSDREIASALSVSPRTVQTHVAGLFSKLGVNSRAEAAAIAVRRNLV